MPIAINGSGTLTGLSVGGLENGIITPAELSTGAPSWDAQYNLTNIASINNGPLAGFRNAIINGNFDVWQRGTSFASLANADYHADRWRVTFNGGGTRTLSRQLFTLGQTDVANEPTYFLKWNQTVAGSGQTVNDLRQRVESVRTFAGQQITLSFYAKAASAATLPSIGVSQFFGSTGSPSSEVYTQAVTDLALTTSWQRFSYTITLPSITGKTLGTDGNDAIDFLIRMPLNATFNIDIAQVQIEAGPVATPFERRPIGTELALCQRYYETSDANGSLFSGNVTSGQGYFSAVDFATNKRGNPSITLTNSSNVSFDSTPGTTFTGKGGFRETRLANATARGLYLTFWTAEAEL